MRKHPRTFGELVRATRKALPEPLTQEGLGERLKVGQPAISAWEAGDTYPEMDKLEDLAQVLELDLGELVRMIAAERRAARPAAAVG